jgi:uncharacterized protein YlxP (DUF503 family)
VIVAVALFEIHIPYAQSLKEKRMVVRSLRDRLRGRFDVAANEVALQDLHQRARIAISFIVDNTASADAILDRLRGFVESNTDATVVGWTSEKLDFDETTTL